MPAANKLGAQVVDVFIDATGMPWIVRRNKSNLHRNVSAVPMRFTNIIEA